MDESSRYVWSVKVRSVILISVLDLSKSVRGSDWFRYCKTEVSGG